MDIFDFDYMLACTPQIMKGIPVSLSIAVVAILFGLIIGLVIALVRIHEVPVINTLSMIYVSFFRGTPLIVQIFLCYYGLPLLARYLNAQWGLHLDISSIPAIFFIYVSLSLNVSSYLSETIRGAIQSVPQGQIEAAQSIGMNTYQTYKRIILPQALSYALPNFTNTFISILKDTSLAFVASVPEIMGQAKMISGRTSKFLETYLIAALLYWLLCISMEIILRQAEKMLLRHKKGLKYAKG